MSYDPGYTKANVSYEANKTLKALAKERTRMTGQRTYVYNIIDELLEKVYPDRFKEC